MPLKKLWLDFESYWDDAYTLRKLSPIEYINDPRFEALGCGFVDETDTRMWVDGPDLPMIFQKIDWPNTFAISHNALFDMVILSARYGIVPGLYGDTLSMARNWLAHRLRSLSLEKICEHYGMQAKWSTAQKFKGMNLIAIKQDPALYAELSGYAIDDAGKCKRIFANMTEEGFPEGEFEIIDMVIRMATQPKFELDQFVLSEHLGRVKAEKQQLLDEAMIEKGDISSIMSDQQLAVKLFRLGVAVPMKTSMKTGKQAFAFAKTDKQFTDLLEHDDPLVQALVAARLGHKSTLEETRTERLLAISRVTTKMPIPLKYSGAHTHRFSGDWKINEQNLRRGGELRRAHRAPRGMKVVAVDASQIEARFNAELSGEEQLLDAFREGRDVYAEFAFDIYGYTVHKMQHPIERFVGKTGILSLGYGSSAPVFQNMCRNDGGVILQDHEAGRIVGLYRGRYARIVQNWRYAQKTIIPQLMLADEVSAEVLRGLRGLAADEPVSMWGPVEVHPFALVLPNGNKLRYRDLHYQTYDDADGGGGGYEFMRGDRRLHLYGAKLVENVIQALAFVHIMETAVRVKRRTGFMPSHQVHDELIYLPPDSVAEALRDVVVEEMARSPSWMPNAPLAAEGHVGSNYWEAK
jgi:DNA polymerase bacteriophage-type